MESKLIKALVACFDKPPEKAVAYLESQGFKVTHDWRQALKAIKQHCFTVSKVAEADLLQIIHDELDAAIADGKSYKDFVKEAPKTIQSKGFATKSDGSAFRFELIYRMNMQTAYQSGQFWEMELANDDFPYRQFVAVNDDRTTTGCHQLDNAIFHHNDKFYLTNQTPRHFMCRSTWISLSAAEAKGKIKTGKDFKKIKPEEGFGLNPKEAKYKPDLNKYTPAIREQLMPDVK